MNKELKQSQKHFKKYLKSELKFQKSLGKFLIELIKKGKKKIPEKLSTWFSVKTTQSDEENVEYANYNFETMYEKINEIVDYLKSKGE